MGGGLGAIHVIRSFARRAQAPLNLGDLAFDYRCMGELPVHGFHQCMPLPSDRLQILLRVNG